MLTIAPPSRSSRAACRLTTNVPRTLVGNGASNVSRPPVGSRTETDLSDGVDDDVDAPERLDRLSEQPLDVELVGDVAANGERGAVGGEDLLDGGVGGTLVPGVVDDDGVAPARQRAHDLTAETARASRDDRHAVVCVVSSAGVATPPLWAADARRHTRGVPGRVPGRYARGTMATQRQPLFRGRISERDVLDRLLEQVREGQSAALVIHGEAGVGKTALVRYAVRQASGFRVAEIAGVESEMELAYAGVHQLCTPMLAHLDALPEPQQRAVLVAFGLSSGDAPDRFLVALATLSLLAQVAEERPLLCVVEDAQWLDDASGQVLGFVARRLLAESVAMVFAVREPSDQRELVGLPDLPLGGLPEADARALLATVVPGRLDEFVRDRIIAETHGNPLALLELPRGMSVGGAGRGLRPARHRRPSGSHRGALPATPCRFARADTATDARGGGGPGRRCDAGLACRPGARHRD